LSEAIERASTANSLLDAALLRPVVANCRAGANEALTWASVKKVQTAKRLGIRMRYLFVSDLENDSLNLFQPTAEAISQYMPIIFVANLERIQRIWSFFESQGVSGAARNCIKPVVQLGLFDWK